MGGVGAFGVYLLLAESIGLGALAGAGRFWKCCGIDCGTGWAALDKQRAFFNGQPQDRANVGNRPLVVAERQTDYLG